MLSVLDRTSDELGFHYEIDSGTLLGAVKFNNFVPWDIDADVDISSRAIFDFFQPGQLGTRAFEKDSIAGFPVIFIYCIVIVLEVKLKIRELFIC